jgi:AraC-like DNA-binding protein
MIEIRTQVMMGNRTDFERTNEQLKERVLRLTTETGNHPTALAGLKLSRRVEASNFWNAFNNPLVGVIVQGCKHSIIGNKEYHYGEGHCLIVGVDMPSKNYITSASSEKPFLALSLDPLDRSLVAQLAAEIPSSSKGNRSCKGVAVAESDPKILSAFLRLIDLLDEPGDIPILAPMIIKEIYYRLLKGTQGEWLRMVCTLGTRTNQIAEAISWLRTNYREPFGVDMLAKKVNMATSTFHRHFREVTNFSPLQFQKQLRLYEAQRLMILDNVGVNTAAHIVGYESSTQFIREYKRLFGEPPHRNVANIR